LVQSLTIDLQENGKIRPCVDNRALNSKKCVQPRPYSFVEKALEYLHNNFAMASLS
jgi:hypothetical protein